MTGRRLSALLLYAAFAASGVAAIFYQLIWQRALLNLYGVQVESVTIVVTGFLVGLGLGTILGGWLADRWPSAALRVFAVLEGSMACAGAVSIDVFRRVGAATADAGIVETSGLVLALLIVPTALMGATLPVLAGYGVRVTRNAGAGVSGFYAANTLGSAAGAIAAVLFVVGTLGQQGTVWAAAGINAIVAVAAVVADRIGSPR